jgi:DNA polymerase
VAAYRREHPKITRFWRDIENAFRYVAKFHRSTALGKWLRFDSYPDCDVVITLPNSRELHYHSVRVKTDEMGREQISVYNHLVQRWEYIWGGGLTENVVQAISRDIMMEAAIRCGDREFRPAHRVHDELIGTAPEASAETGLAVYIEELRRVPEWGPGLPLNAEGHIADRYGAH